MKRKNRNTLILVIFILALIGMGLYLNSMTETIKFEEFSIEAPQGSSFFTMTPDDDKTIKEMYRCSDADLTITSFDEKYIEETYSSQTGYELDYEKGLLSNLTGDSDANVTKINENLTRIIVTSNIDGYKDTDVACLYMDGEHVIVVEGGDVDFITNIGESIKIL